MSNHDFPDDYDAFTPATPFKLISGASTNATAVKTSAGELTWYVFGNQNANVRYLKLYDKASAPTVGTDVPKLVIPMPGFATGHVPFPYPVAFTLGIALALTTGVADSDTGAVAANEIVVGLTYL